MISEARREPSRRNGRCSRGPTTSESKASSSRNAVRHGPSRPAGLDPILAGRGSPRWRAPSQGRMPGCSGSPCPGRVHGENHFPDLPQTKPMSANEANGGKPVKTMFEDEQGELKREQRWIMRPFGHTSRDDVYWLGIRRGCGRLTTIRPNEPEASAARPRARSRPNEPKPPPCRNRAERTRGGAPRASLWPNEPEDKPTRTAVTERTQAGSWFSTNASALRRVSKHEDRKSALPDLRPNVPVYKRRLKNYC